MTGVKTEGDTQPAEAACARLITAHCYAIDHNDAETFVGAFTADGEWRRPGGEALHGHEALRAYFLARPPTISRHVCTNVVVTVTGADDAVGTSLATLYRSRATGAEGPAPLGGPLGIVEYTDDLVRTADGWRIRRRHSELVFAAGATGSPTGDHR